MWIFTWVSISILELLTSLFKDDEFKTLYFAFNDADTGHKCQDNVFEYYCCSENYKKSKFFNDEPKSLQLHLYIDSFNPCDALKSHTTVSKKLGVYLQIKNLPRQYLSRLNNIYLIAMCNENDIKPVSLDSVFKDIVREIQILETVGINIGGNVYLKGTLATFVFDNLGGNQLLGLMEKFSQDFFCRLCVCTKRESEYTTREDTQKLRSKVDYLSQIYKIDQCVTKLRPKLVDGYKKYCILNDINNYHMLDNIVVDMM